MNDMLDSLVARARATEPEVQPRIDPFVPPAIDDGQTVAGESPHPSSVAPAPAEAVDDGQPPDADAMPPPNVARASEAPITRNEIEARVEHAPHPTIRVVTSERIVREVVRVEPVGVAPVERRTEPTSLPRVAPPVVHAAMMPAPTVTVTPVTPVIVVPERAGPPAQRDQPPEPVPTVHVTIGRLEIRATTPSTPAEPRARSEPRITSLDDYLQQRAERTR